MNRTDIKKDIKEEYKEYTLGLAVFDFLPVFLFFISGILIYRMYESPVLLTGVLACFLGGLSKAVWKAIVVLRGEDRVELTRAFHILMPAGFALMIISVLIGGAPALSGLWHSLSTMPAALFFICGFLLMCIMGYLGSHMDKSARSNWIEEAVNTLAQAAVLIGVITIYLGK